MAANAEIHAQVLLVDDDRGHAETMAEALKKPGHVCTIRHSRAEAEDELRHGAFDVIVTDLVMEGPTAGLEVLELAKRLQPDAETIMVTAHGDIPTAKKALQGGAYVFIEKPLDLVSSATWCSAPPRRWCSGTRTARGLKPIESVEPGFPAFSNGLMRLELKLDESRPGNLSVQFVRGGACRRKRFVYTCLPKSWRSIAKI